MTLIIQVLTTIALAVGGAAALPEGVRPGKTFGGPHGDEYSDLELVSPGQVVNSVTIRGSDRVDAVGLDVTDPDGQQLLLYHGGDGGESKTLILSKDEHIVGVFAQWVKYYRKTRLMYLKFTTDKNNTISGGYYDKETDKQDSDNAPKGFQLGGFEGYCGNELDSMRSLWTSIEPDQQD
ncbi:hypothetical protein F441_01259 [Phytophthora nicotianae CJ01A1]|uniref:Jacalin-type lectin domain-containing protein n=7 Tax=Phytophthora nicotianae TaxID=4792 RepID=W2RHS0_PHYN3|nr:hypothetical protein PPTG_01094 [Phytophthora nicotianae INRA-310]ETI56109.1 hypothetical protein F443_01282 [Phytophthora nicotianae P1569]ETK95921.1 hypothetical protein L915_01209 [Phytophthora nicotianae]ETO84860.1 hypothetical protein F444_01281 [Phytophthora nicotianae P1976]ETP25918.1 hypothetical protein F441_01259 [Phytophthora nicotianae CJ01A1]ETP53923.1 hypothetical protein F442_01223 [Phytophthora nicotianae P10297]KUF91129.1 hypothetical protein AM587_10015212 [Phytophthora n